MHFGARGGKLIENINERKSGHKSVSTFSFNRFHFSDAILQPSPLWRFSSLYG
jgi:hypothetical protein